MKTSSRFNTSLFAAAAVAALMLAACDKADEPRSAGQKLDSAMASAERKTEVAKDAVKQEIGDAAITAAVNAELVKDPALSALRINVDTSQGQVSLRGTAPDAAARDRATQIAASVKGVNRVDNQLVVPSRG